MNFTDFQLLRTRLLTERSELLDAAETNLYRSLAPLIPEQVQAVESLVHRCHLASQWVSLFGLLPETSRRAFITCGVRDSLRILFHHLARRPGTLWLPEDNYPAYYELAADAGLAPRMFPTLLEIGWPQETPDVALEWEWLLLTHPLKPRGRSLDVTDTARLRQWLAASSKRRVVLDTVYTLETRFDALTHELMATGKVVLLHSLTKGWLHPRCFGVALMPEQDATEWMPVFRLQPPPQKNLATARHLMTHHAGLPAKIAKTLTTAQTRMLEAMRHMNLDLMPVDAMSYLVPVKARWEDMFAEKNVLGLPAAVFGSHRDDLIILSTLRFLP